MRFQYKAGGSTAQAHFCHIFGKISDRASGSERTRARHTMSAEDGRFAGGDKTSRASPGNARAPSYIAGKFLARFVFKKRLLYTFLFMEVVGFGVSNVFAIKQNPKRRTTRAPSPRFPAIFAPIRAPGRRPGDRRAPEPQPRAAAARQNLKSRFTGFFRRPDPAFSSELSRRTRPVIVRDARTRRDKPPTGGRESVRR